MSRTALLSMMLVAWAVLARSAAACGEDRAPSAGAAADTPFAWAVLAPSDATLYVHVEDAAGVRRLIARRPLARGIAGVLEEGEIRTAWRRLATAIECGGDELLDLWLGRSATLIMRSTDWAMVTEVDPAAARDAIERLAPRGLPPRASLPVVELPEHELLVAARGATWIVGPAPGGGMPLFGSGKNAGVVFDELLVRIGADGGDAGTLADDPMLAAGRALGPGRVGVFVRHDPFIGGASAVVADVEGDRLRVRHTARFDTPPFERGIPQAPIDMAPLRLFEDHALVALIEPTDVGDGTLELYAQLVLGTPLLSADMRRNLAGVRVLAVGEVEGRREAPPRDCLEPTGAVALRVRDPQDAEAQLDRHMTHLARKLAEHAARANGAEPVIVPDASALPDGVPRHVTFGGIGAGAPALFRSASLDWTVARTPIGCYYVIATHPQHLRDTVAALESSSTVPLDPQVDRWASCGTIDGERLALHLGAHGDGAPGLARDAIEAETLGRTLHLLSELCAGIDRCRWRLRRPTAETMSLEIEITLAPPESADPRDAGPR